MGKTVVSPSTSKKEGKPLYVEVEYPDQRKRINVTYKDERIVIFVKENDSLSTFLNLVIDRFKLESAIKPLLRIKTEYGRRIQSLSSTFNNQVVEVTVSTNKFQDSLEEEEDNKAKKQEEELKQKEEEAKEEAFLSTSKFLKEVQQLKQLYPNQVQIGESIPYRIQVLLSIDNVIDNCYLYVIENALYEKNSALRVGDFIINSTSQELHNLIKKTIEDLINGNQSDLITIVKGCIESFSKWGVEYKVPLLPENFTQMFNDNYKTVTTIPKSNFIKIIEATIHTVVETCNLLPSLALYVLLKSNWNVKKVRKYLRMNPSVHSKFGNKIECYSFGQSKATAHTPGECTICYCEFEDGNDITLLCGHRFCTDCMSQYADSLLQDGNGTNAPIKCPWKGCTTVLDIVTLSTLFAYNTKRITHLNSMLLNDVMFYSKTKWCPTNGCNRIVHIPEGKYFYPFIPCACGETLCLRCKSKHPHYPAACDANIFEMNDSSSYLWIAQNTTLCAKCKNAVERNGGCNHMSCTRCQHQFCYVCGADFTSKHYSCTAAKGTSKIQRFRKLMGGDRDTALISEFLLANHDFRGKPLNKMYFNLFGLSFKLQARQISNTVEETLYLINEFIKDKVQPFNREYTLSSIRKNLLKIEAAMKLQPTEKVEKETVQDQGPDTRSLVCSISLNGRLRVLSTILVFSNFSDFKEDIKTVLAQSGHADHVTPQFSIYNRYGGLIKASNQIIYGEQLFIASQGEPFQEPINQEAPGIRRSYTMNTDESLAKLNLNDDDLLLKSKKSPTLQDANNTNNNNNTSTISDEELNLVADRIADLLNVEFEDAADIVQGYVSTAPFKDTQQLVNHILSNKMWENNKPSDKFRDKQSQDYKSLETLLEMFPMYSEKMIETVLLDCNCNLEWATTILKKESGQQANTTNKNEADIEYYDDDDDSYDDEYLEYVEDVESKFKFKQHVCEKERW